MFAARRFIRLISILLVSMGAMVGLGAIAQETRPDPARPVVHSVPLTGPIGPATSAFITNAIEEASGEADAVIILMDTPGGLIDAMRDINLAILDSDVPVIVYVAPPGARATSAGAYILYASHLAAMAPGTTVGAATPVSMGPMPGTTDEESEDGSETSPDPAPGDDQAMRNKIVNDSVASIRSLAEMRGRNADWAERAVREGVSLTAENAYQEGVVELLADDMTALLAAADGMSVDVQGRGEIQLRLAGAEIVEVEPGFANRLLSIITNPNIAFLLVNIGFIGLLVSFYNGLEPVTLIAGLICLIVGFYALNTLPVNYAGAALILLGLGMLVAEAFVTSYGVLTIVGLLVFALGGVMLIDTEVPALRIDWRMIAAVGLSMGGLTFAVLSYGLAAQTRRVTTGRESLSGMEGEVLEWDGRTGFVHVDGERWAARSKDALEPGDRIKVTGVSGLTLTVKKLNGSRV